jgi:hypothetical protein
MVGMSLPDFCRKPPQSCLVGKWTGVNFDVHVENITETGGAGVTMHIDPKGNLTVNFNGMKPVVFHFDTGGQDFAATSSTPARSAARSSCPPAARPRATGSMRPRARSVAWRRTSRSPAR